MTETDGAADRNQDGRQEPERPPVTYRVVTANQVVAWNLARYRRAAGMTQEQLGLAIGWTMDAVSAAERSWRSGRTREFDAQALTEIAVALAVPITALLLPPDPDEGELVEVRNQQGALSFAEYLELAVMPDTDLEESATEAYRDRYVALAHQYLSPEWAAHVGRLMRGHHSPEWIADLAAMLRDHQHDAEASAHRWGVLAAELEDLAKEEK